MAASRDRSVTHRCVHAYAALWSAPTVLYRIELGKDGISMLQLSRHIQSDKTSVGERMLYMRVVLIDGEEHFMSIDMLKVVRPSIGSRGEMIRYLCDQTNTDLRCVNAPRQTLVMTRVQMAAMMKEVTLRWDATHSTEVRPGVAFLTLLAANARPTGGAEVPPPRAFASLHLRENVVRFKGPNEVLLHELRIVPHDSTSWRRARELHVFNDLPILPVAARVDTLSAMYELAAHASVAQLDAMIDAEVTLRVRALMQEMHAAIDALFLPALLRESPPIALAEAPTPAEERPRARKRDWTSGLEPRHTRSRCAF